ncbi:MAG TPA: ECF-type sigma factor, partial [Planctomycetota bacterium]|nr:ECF-type sigma factor [Planctomycetota bacterium]
RNILVERARRKSSEKHGGAKRVAGDPEELQLGGDAPGRDLVALDDALRRLEADDPTRARIVELRFFGGLTHEQIAEALSIPLRTIEREWRVARTRLQRELKA